MQIQGFGQYGGFYQQNRVSPIKQVSVDQVKQQDELKKQQEESKQTVESLQKEYAQATPDTRSRTADLENISLTFNAGETYDYIGKDAGYENLDMMRAISDMQKDKVLEQYQYFVGPQDIANNVISNNEDGTVIQK